VRTSHHAKWRRRRRMRRRRRRNGRGEIGYEAG
jgi:hypothetical protein